MDGPLSSGLGMPCRTLRWALTDLALLALVLPACGDGGLGRELKANLALHVEVDDGLSVDVLGATVVDAVGPSDGRPGRVRLRASALDFRVLVTDLGCDARSLEIEIDNVAAAAGAEWQAFRGAITPAERAERECCGALFGRARADDHPDWTPLGERVSFVASGCPSAVTEEGLSDRRRCFTLRTRPSTQSVGIDGSPSGGIDGSPSGGIDGSPSGPTQSDIFPSDEAACVQLSTLSAGAVSSAPLIVEHHFSFRPIARPDADGVPALKIAVFGNHAGHTENRRRLVEAVSAVALDEGLALAVVTGDLGKDGSPSQLKAAVSDLDALPIPYFVTVGDRDITGASAETLIPLLGPLRGVIDVSDSEAEVAFRLILLDTAEGTMSSRAFGDLESWLSKVGAPVTRLVAMHVPPFDPNGYRGMGFSSRREALRLMGALHRGAVGTAFSGHLATYAEQTLATTRFFHSGGGGAPMESDDGFPFHFLVVSVNARGRVFVQRRDL